MRLAADNLWATVQDATEEELNWLASYLSVPVKNAEHSDAYQAGHWDGLVRLFDKRRQRFASGLIRMVYGRAKEGGIRVVVDDVREKPGAPIDPAAGTWLRDYQRDALGAMLARGRGIVSIPTGGGKTVLMAAAVQALPLDWLVLVDTRDLMHQGALAIAKLIREDVGECGDGIWRPRRVTVATLQTLYQGVGTDGRVNALLERARGLLCDEVQTVSAPQAHKVALACPNAYYRFGVSATPLEREDEADYRAIEALGPLIYEIDAKPLIDAGWLARPEIYFVEFQHEKMTGSYAEVYEAGIVFSDKRNELVARLASTALAPRPTLVFFKKHAHAPRLARLINRAATVEVIDGRNSTRARDKARHRLVTGQIDVLMTSKIFNKGIDMPQVESAVNAAAGASSTDALQKVGRIMRPLGGQKTVVRFWDVMDLRNRWFADHARRRLDAFRGRGYDAHVVAPSDVAALARAA